MTYKNQEHQKYADYLNSKGIPFIYREVFVEYQDTLTGKRKKYYIDFVLLKTMPEWVEVTKILRPMDKRIYAKRRAKEAGIIYRPLNKEEIDCIYKPNLQ